MAFLLEKFKILKIERLSDKMKIDYGKQKYWVKNTYDYG